MEKIGYFNYCLNIFWSLSVEEIFYVIFPLMCLLFKKTRFILLFLATLIIISPLYRSHYSENEIVALCGYLSCFDAIAFGCLAAIIAHKIELSNRLGGVLFYSAIFSMVGVYLYNGIMESVVLGVTLMGLSAAVFLISVGNSKVVNIPVKSLFSRSICWFGRNSYELYLFHIVVLALIKEMISRDALGGYTKLLWMAVFFIVSALVAGFISKFYSQPLNNKIRHFLLHCRDTKTYSPESMSGAENI